MGITNFSKVIELELYSDTDSFKIICPPRGIKPNITISGTLTGTDLIDGFEVRIVNLYTDRILENFHTLSVTAGYEGGKTSCIEGSIATVYTETPGPDKVTVFQCLTANIREWLSATCSLYFDEGTPIQDIINKLSAEIGFSTPVMGDLKGTLIAPMQFTGHVKDAIHEIRSFFSGVSIRIDNNRFIACETDTGVVYDITVLSSPPQFTGVTVSVVAPWIPQIRPSDRIRVKTAYYVQDSAAKSVNKNSVYKVNSIQFEFSTVGDTNSMTVVGTSEVK